LDDRYHSKGITGVSLHPGTIETKALNDVMFGLLGYAAEYFISLVRPLLKSPTQGAATSIYCATAPQIEKLGGGYFCDVNVTPTSLEDVVHNKTLTKLLWENTDRMIEEKLR